MCIKLSQSTLTSLCLNTVFICVLNRNDMKGHWQARVLRCALAVYNMFIFLSINLSRHKKLRYKIVQMHIPFYMFNVLHKNINPSIRYYEIFITVFQKVTNITTTSCWTWLPGPEPYPSILPGRTIASNSSPFLFQTSSQKSMKMRGKLKTDSCLATITNPCRFTSITITSRFPLNCYTAYKM